jgi:hypothetical protein
LPVINGSYECPCCGEKSEKGKQDVQEPVGGHHCSNFVQYQVLWVVSYFEASSKAERKPCTACLRERVLGTAAGEEVENFREFGGELGFKDAKS